MEEIKRKWRGWRKRCWSLRYLRDISNFSQSKLNSSSCPPDLVPLPGCIVSVNGSNIHPVVQSWNQALKVPSLSLCTHVKSFRVLLFLPSSYFSILPFDFSPTHTTWIKVTVMSFLIRRKFFQLVSAQPVFIRIKPFSKTHQGEYPYLYFNYDKIHITQK